MKRKILLIAAIATTIILSSCGMKVEEIDPALTNLTSAYQGGAYEQAETLVKDLKKAYRKMSDEQKSKFDELKSEVEYAISTVDEIYNDFNNAQDLYDKKMYYESSQALDKLSADYTLPPTEQKKYDEKKADVDAAIKRLKVNEAFKKVESAYNGGDYDLASNELSVIDTSSMSDEQKEIQQTWQKKINASKSFVQAESDYNNGNYSSALSILYGIDTTYLAADQIKKWSELKDQATAPKLVDGNTMVPAEFYRDNFGVSVIWDDVTSSLFINSEDTYNWLVNTYEYQQTKNINQTWNEIQGYYFYEGDPYTQSVNMQFNSDGTFSMRTWRVKGYGTYTVTDDSTVEVNYDVYFKGAGSRDFRYDYSTYEQYYYAGGGLLFPINEDGITYDGNRLFEHRGSFTDIPGQE